MHLRPMPEETQEVDHYAGLPFDHRLALDPLRGDLLHHKRNLEWAKATEAGRKLLVEAKARKLYPYARQLVALINFMEKRAREQSGQ